MEIAACGNVKRSWVSYGIPRDWTSMEQGQVGWNVPCTTCIKVPPSLSPSLPPSLSPSLSLSFSLSQGEEFLYQSTEVKNVWLPMGEIFAN